MLLISADSSPEAQQFLVQCFLFPVGEAAGQLMLSILKLFTFNSIRVNAGVCVELSACPFAIKRLSNASKDLVFSVDFLLSLGLHACGISCLFHALSKMFL